MESRSFFDGLFQLRKDLQTYLETKVSYYGLSAFEKAVRLLTIVVGNGVIISTLALALMFLSGAFALYIGSLLGNPALGLLITGGFYLLMAVMLAIFRKKIFGPGIIRSLSNIFFNDDQGMNKN